MSQVSRTVVVASPASGKSQKYQTTATTWGEFKSQISELLVGDVDAILSEGRVTLKRDDATLPVGNFNIYLIPVKNKAGMTTDQAKQLAREIGDAIVRGATHASQSEVEELKDSLIGVIQDFFGVDEDCPECEEALQEARRLM